MAKLKPAVADLVDSRLQQPRGRVMARYGVFSLGQLWSLHSSAGWVRAYASRLKALEAAWDALAADGDQERELILHDETGFLAMAPAPRDR